MLVPLLRSSRGKFPGHAVKLHACVCLGKKGRVFKKGNGHGLGRTPRSVAQFCWGCFQKGKRSRTEKNGVMQFGRGGIPNIKQGRRRSDLVA